MNCIATVVVPTHAHAKLLPYAVRSALAQTVEDIEIFIVGDGVEDDTRKVVSQLQSEDSRIRFFDFPKGPRNGEGRRHQVLAEANGKIVSYLCDDDLWLPGHVASMSELLQSSDFAHSLPLQVTPSGDVWLWTGDLSLAQYREQLLNGGNFVPFSCSAHTLAAYKRLPTGWRTTPPGIPTDLYMFQQFLEQSWCSAVSGWLPTTIHFPSPDRTEWTADQREAELARFADLVSTRDDRWIIEACLRLLGSDRARLEHGFISLNSQLAHLSEAHHDAIRVRDQMAERVELLGAEIAGIKASRTWRARQRLLDAPLSGSVLRGVAKVLSGRAAN